MYFSVFNNPVPSCSYHCGYITKDF
uniref:Uncharacterized protein n=1 Tax=Anguilla anguilla TaxID=7936 RepID=A0A0E9SUW1_ANGAN